MLLRLQRVLLREEALRQANQQRDGIFAGELLEYFLYAHRAVCRKNWYKLAEKLIELFIVIRTVKARIET